MTSEVCTHHFENIRQHHRNRPRRRRDAADAGQARGPPTRPRELGGRRPQSKSGCRPPSAPGRPARTWGQPGATGAIVIVVVVVVRRRPILLSHCRPRRSHRAVCPSSVLSGRHPWSWWSEWSCQYFSGAGRSEWEVKAPDPLGRDYLVAESEVPLGTQSPRQSLLNPVGEAMNRRGGKGRSKVVSRA